MKRKFLIIIFAILLCLATFGCSKENEDATYSEKQYLSSDFSTINGEVVNEVSPIADTVVTMRDIASFLEDKKEHYPLSDEFIERYQQSSGGYIDNARKAGLIVDKQQHEPNQKWHFFESWLYPTIEEGMAWTETAENRVYKKLLCPELLLWIYEACEVSPEKVKAAKDVAEAGKSSKLSVATIAKNMRACVAWEDLEKAILEHMSNDTDAVYYNVSVNTGSFNVKNLSNQYKEGVEVSFSINVTDLTKQIDTVTANGETLRSSNGSTYKFTMPAGDVAINVTLKDKEITNTPNVNLNSTAYNIVYDLGTGKQAKKIQSLDELYKTFVYASEGSGMITSILQMENIYGGGYGGSGDTRWYTGNMLKFGTTSVCGSLTMELNTAVNCVKITGYVSNIACEIQVGDSASLDWGSGSDGKTSTLVCSEMTVTTKDAVESGQVGTVTIYFESTTSLKIATTNKKPLYITAIELLVTN